MNELIYLVGLAFRNADGMEQWVAAGRTLKGMLVKA